MGPVQAKFKGEADVDTKNALVFNNEEAYTTLKAAVDNDPAIKAKFEAILAENTNGMTTDSFWESHEPQEWLTTHLQHEQRAEIALAIDLHLNR